MPQSLPDAARLLADLERVGGRVVLVTAGGAAAAVAHLLSTPGASGVVLEGLCPTARGAVDRLLGGPQEGYASSRTARRLAVTAWRRGCELAGDPTGVVGVAVTAALKTREPKRGPHRVVVATHTLSRTSVATLVLTKDARSRDEEEAVAAALALERLADAAGAAAAGRAEGGLALLAGEAVEVEDCEAPPEWRGLLDGSLRLTRATAAVPRSGRSQAALPIVPGMLVFPGAFDPLHEGHQRMAIVAEEIAERPLDFEISVTNVDKPLLDYLEMRARAAQFTGRSLWFTRAATFLEKLDLFPGGTFVMGADTYVRLADPRYYGGSADQAARAVERIASQARGLIVFGRERNGSFEDPARLDVPAPLRDVTYFVSQREFRMDISSTVLRRAAAAADAATISPGDVAP